MDLFDNLKPVFTVNDKKYTQPTQDEGGLYVVDKSVIPNASENTFYLYNPYTKKYYYANEQTTSPDNLKRLREYEASVRETMEATKYISNSADSTQVNSVADVVSMLLSFKPISAIKGAGELVHNTVLAPLFDPDLKGKRTLTLLNNLAINLGETLDYATGANIVKGTLQGKNPFKGQFWDAETGRAQYDWNVKTGAGAFADTATNIFLEILSDPTNWITFGGKSLLTSAAKSSVDDVAIKAGLTVNSEYVEKYFRHLRINNMGAYSTDTFDLVKAFNLPNTVTSDYLFELTKSLKTAMDTKAAFKHINLINSVLGGTDYILRRRI